jgi:hypothetical protein
MTTRVTIIVLCFVECLPEHGRKMSKHVQIYHMFVYYVCGPG